MAGTRHLSEPVVLPLEWPPCPSSRALQALSRLHVPIGSPTYHPWGLRLLPRILRSPLWLGSVELREEVGPVAQYLVQMDHILFTCSFVGHLGHFCFLAVTITAAMNISIEVLCGHTSSYLLGMYVGAKLLPHMVTLCKLCRNCQTFP